MTNGRPRGTMARMLRILIYVVGFVVTIWAAFSVLLDHSPMWLRIVAFFAVAYCLGKLTEKIADDAGREAPPDSKNFPD